MDSRYPKKPKTTKLTAAFVKNAPPGKHYDTNGLFLKVELGGSRRWIQRISIHGTRRDIGLGGYPLVSLAEARQVAFDNRKLARAGGDPIALKRRPDIPTFSEAIETVLEIHKKTWRNPRSAKIWRASLQDYAVPRLGNKRVDQIDTADVMTVLMAIWNDKPETARRIRQRIGTVMKWAVAQNFRSDNPAGEAIAAALPKANGGTRHFRALPYAEVGTAIEKIRQSGAHPGTKLAFEFLVLTAARSGEVRGAKWHEIDFEKATWTIQPERMKTAREHRVPLSSRALEVLTEAREFADGSDLIFPSVMGKALSDATLSKLLRENGIKGVPHGFRSSFRDWCAESGVAREVAEACLAHAARSKIEAAYFRSDVFERRREVMSSWANYLAENKSPKP